MSYSAKSFSALINAMRADGIARLEQLARQSSRNAQSFWSAEARKRKPYSTAVSIPPGCSTSQSSFGWPSPVSDRQTTGTSSCRSTTFRRPPFSGEISSFRRRYRQMRPAQTLYSFAVKKTLSKKLTAVCQYADALA